MALLTAACATTYGPALSSASRATSDVYLYGPHRSGTSANAKERVPAVASVSASGVASKEKDKDAGTEDATKGTASASRGSTAASEEHDAAEPRFAAGTYRGTDWMVIDLPGFPGNEQVDDKARVVLESLPTKGHYTFTVLDTNSGKALCSVQGAVIGDLIAFESEQTCFDGILGIPMEASLYDGEASIKDGKLEVTLDIAVSLEGPDGEISGDLSYRFEGKLSE